MTKRGVGRRGGDGRRGEQDPRRARGEQMVAMPGAETHTIAVPAAAVAAAPKPEEDVEIDALQAGSTPSGKRRRDEKTVVSSRPTPSRRARPVADAVESSPGRLPRRLERTHPSLVHHSHAHIHLPSARSTPSRRRERDATRPSSSHLPSAGREMASAAFAASARALSTANLARTSSTADASFSLVFCATSARARSTSSRTAVARSVARLSAATASSSAVCARWRRARGGRLLRGGHSLGARGGHIVDAAGHGGFRAREVDVALVTRVVRGGSR